MPEQQDEFTRDELTTKLAEARAERNQMQSDYQDMVANGEREIVLLRASIDILKIRMELINFRASINAHYFMALEVGFVDSEAVRDARLTDLESSVATHKARLDGLETP